MLEDIHLTTDNNSIVSNNNVLGLRDYGLKYYKFIPASGEEGAEDYVASHYELQEVDNENPWSSGLEPRVTLENGELVLGWFEQNPTTLDGINATLSSLQNEVSNVKNDLTDLQSVVANKIDKDLVYTKEEANLKISEAIADADHLRRKVVNEYEDIQKYIDTYKDSAQYIFMVPIGLSDYDNKYEEYVVIDGIIEPVGNWSVNLDDYVKKDELLFTAINNDEF